MRDEWWKSDGVSFYEATAGINYFQHANLVIRPEIRWNHSPTAVSDAANFDANHVFGIDMIATF